VHLSRRLSLATAAIAVGGVVGLVALLLLGPSTCRVRARGAGDDRRPLRGSPERRKGERRGDRRVDRQTLSDLNAARRSGGSTTRG
jgi:hypothetical protein